MGAEGGSGGGDGGDAGGGPAVEGVDEGLDGVCQRGEAVLDGHGTGGQHCSLKPGVTQADAAELREAKRRIRLLEQENEIPRRAAAYLS